MIGLRDDEAAVAATDQALPADVLYRLLQHPEERVRILWYKSLPTSRLVPRLAARLIVPPSPLSLRAWWRRGG